MVILPPDLCAPLDKMYPFAGSITSQTSVGQRIFLVFSPYLLSFNWMIQCLVVKKISDKFSWADCGVTVCIFILVLIS